MEVECVIADYGPGGGGSSIREQTHTHPSEIDTAYQLYSGKKNTANSPE